MPRPLGVGEDWGLGGLSPSGSCLQHGASDFSWHLKGRIIGYWQGYLIQSPGSQSPGSAKGWPFPSQNSQGVRLHVEGSRCSLSPVPARDSSLQQIPFKSVLPHSLCSR